MLRLIAAILMLEFWVLGLILIGVGATVVGLIWAFAHPFPCEASFRRALTGLALAARATFVFPFRGDWRSL